MRVQYTVKMQSDVGVERRFRVADRASAEMLLEELRAAHPDALLSIVERAAGGRRAPCGGRIRRAYLPLRLTEELAALPLGPSVATAA